MITRYNYTNKIAFNDLMNVLDDEGYLCDEWIDDGQYKNTGQYTGIVKIDEIGMEYTVEFGILRTGKRGSLETCVYTE